MKRRRTRIVVGVIATLLVASSIEVAAPVSAASASESPATFAAQRQQRLTMAQRARNDEARNGSSAQTSRALALLRAAATRRSARVRQSLAAAAAYTVSVTPDTNLVPGQLVTVDGRGFSDGLIVVLQCANDPSTSLVDCDPLTNAIAPIDNRGGFSLDYNVSRTLRLSGGSVVDCATVAGGCDLSWTNLLVDTETGSNSLTFDPNATIHATLTATPSTGLVHSQLVHITGSGFPQDSEVDVVQCPTGLEPADCRNTAFTFTFTDQNGAIDDVIAVRRVISGPSGSVDCATSACELIATGIVREFTARTAIGFDPNGPVPEPIVVSVMPDSGLLHQQTVAVRGSGFGPNDVGLVEQCVVGAQGPFGSDCVVSLEEVSFDSTGHLDTTFVVRRVINGFDGQIDCADVACEIHVLGFESQSEASAPIAFDGSVPPPAAPTIAVEPSTGLVNAQFVTVTGAGFAFPGEAFITECVADSICNNQGLVDIEADGTFTLELRVRRILTSLLTGSLVDCADPSAACEITAVDDSGFSPTAPISFAPGPPPPPARLSLTPTRTLKDRQSVTITGEGFFPGDFVLSAECATDTTTGEDLACASFVEADVDESGRIVIAQRAFRRLRVQQDVEDLHRVRESAPTVVDCLDVGIACNYKVVGSGLDVQAELPIRFDRGAPLAAPPMITVSPATKLRDRQRVAVHGTGFIEGESVPILECDNNDVEVIENCRNAGGATAGAKGVFDVTIKVRKKIVGPESVTNCVTTQCFVLAGLPSGDPAYPAAASLVFDRGAPVHSPRLRIEPNRHLTDGQIVTVTGADFSPYSDVVIIECPTGVAGYGACDLDEFFITQADARGRISTQYTVNARPALGSDGDCLTAPGCSLFAGNASDATESVSRPLYFGSQSASRLRSRTRVNDVRRLTRM